jgi:Acetyltransferases
MIQYRIALFSDAPTLLQTRRQAVMGNHLGLYSEEVLQAWAPQLNPESIAAEEALLQGGDRLTIVAEDAGSMVGLCSLGLSEGLIKQCYVLSEHQGQGIAKRLMEMAEAEAAARGISCLRLSASLIALGFYEKMDYRKMYDYLYELGPGLFMPCVMMEKAL